MAITEVFSLLTVLTFFERLLSDRPYFGGEHLTLAEVVAGTVVPELPSIGISLDDYPKLSAWSKGLMERTTWAMTQPSPEEMEAVKTRIRAVLAGQQTR